MGSAAAPHRRPGEAVGRLKLTVPEVAVPFVIELAKELARRNP